MGRHGIRIISFATMLGGAVFNSQHGGALAQNSGAPYVFVSSIYQANGDLTYSGAGQVFPSKPDCARYLKSMYDKVASDPGSRRVGTSVIEIHGGTLEGGYVWEGCIPKPYSEPGSPYYAFIQQRMTLERAKTISAFPNLPPYSPQPVVHTPTQLELSLEIKSARELCRMISGQYDNTLALQMDKKYALVNKLSPESLTEADKQCWSLVQK